MTLQADIHHDSVTGRQDRPRVPLPWTGEREPDATQSATWGWAMIEIRADGSWGNPRVIRSAQPIQALSTIWGELASRTPLDPGDAARIHLGSHHVTNGALHEAATAFTRAAATTSSVEVRAICLGHLAHVEALRGKLGRSEHHVRQIHGAAPTHAGVRRNQHAELAQAWIALERAQFKEVLARLETTEDLQISVDQKSWESTSRRILQAKLLMATGEPEAATHLLASHREHSSSPGLTDWMSELVDVTRAESLLAAGEPQRALAAVTPIPARASVEAMVVAAAAYRVIGDARGAQAVLAQAVAPLERAPLPLQIEAWLLEARVADEQNKPDRTRLLVERVLRSANSEGMRRPLMRDWTWLRNFTDRDPVLRVCYREFLASCHFDDHAGRQRGVGGVSDRLLGPTLTKREGQVLDLLAQMYSTDEIAAALFVSANTVKTHLKGIFEKLCVNRRVDAVRRGRQLGLC